MNPADAKLLVVDDNDDNRFTLTRRLAREGYQNVNTANNGREALELMLAKRYDLVLLDIMMPEMNGFEVLEKMKASPTLQNLPVVMISALDEIESIVKCIELGAEDFLPKPFNPTLLRARVGASLEKKGLRDQVRASLERLEHELDAARALQLGMLPQAFPEWSPGKPLEVFALMEPAREVSGDLYDCFYADQRVFCFLVGDVSGKGAPAAMFMARTRSLVRMAVDLWSRLEHGQIPEPAAVAETVNRELCQNNRERMFVSLFLGFIDSQTGALRYINAGHPLPHLLRASGAIIRLNGIPDTPLGVNRDSAYRGKATELGAGDTVFVSSDGVTEAMNPTGEFYGNERLLSELRAHHMANPEQIVMAIKAQVDKFTGSQPKADDVTALALRWRPVF